MVRFAFDECNFSPKQGVCVIAGFVGSKSQWTRFDALWTAAITGKVAEFKAHDFWGRESPYDQWTDAERTAFFNELMNGIRKSKLFLFAAGIVLDDFYALDEGQRRYLTGGVFDAGAAEFIGGGIPDAPYFVPFQYCVVHGGRRAASIDDVADFVFDEQDEFAKYAKRRFVYIKAHPPRGIAGKLGNLDFASSVDSPGVQAADMASFAVRRLWENYTDDVTKYACQRLQERDIAHKLFRKRELESFLSGYTGTRSATA